jgi:GTP-binding protein
VGKSTLFNRLAGKRLALVDDTPGVTRDWREADAKLQDLRFTVIDTAGFDTGDEDPLAPRLRERTLQGAATADACLLIVDARSGVTPLDEAFADLLRGFGPPVLLAANKCESNEAEAMAAEGWELGLGEPILVSAEHGRGLEDLADVLRPMVDDHDAATARAESSEDEDEPQDFNPDTPYVPDPEKPLRLAVMGRPNVGKSTLVNALLGQERMLAGPEAGLTRDAISQDWVWQGEKGERRIRLFDTAGLRRRAKVTEHLERMATSDAVRAVRFAEVVMLVSEPERAFEKQDLQLADLALREGRALMLVINKWDTATDRKAQRERLAEAAGRLLPQAEGLPILFVSAKTGAGLNKLVPAALRLHDDWNAKVKTNDLNRFLAAAQAKHPPPAPGGRRIKFRYMAQTKARPPTFVAFANRPDVVPDSYLRYLVAGIRDSFDLWGTPIRLRLRSGKNPYAS